MEKEQPYLFKIVIEDYNNGEPTKVTEYALSYGITLHDARMCLFSALNSSGVGNFVLENTTAKNGAFITY